MARTVSMSTSPRATRRLQRGAFALLAGAGIVLTPAVAQAAPAQAATTTTAAASSATAQNAVNIALAQVGKPYRYGAAGPDAFDCSGLTSFAYKAAGVDLPRTTGGQRGAGTPVSRSALQPGDLVFFYGGGHASIYIGNNQVVHAATASKPVNVINMDYMPYYAARRVA
jgi:cell wall-associated NlpC family hydrolase